MTIKPSILPGIGAITCVFSGLYLTSLALVCIGLVMIYWRKIWGD